MLAHPNQRHNSTFAYRQNQPITTTRVLHQNDSDSLLSNFPSTRLSYEVSIHKNDTQYAVVKDPTNYTYFILPKGKRCIAWATEWKRNRIFVIIDIQRPNYRRDHHQPNGNRGGGLMNDNERPFIRKFYQENGWCPGKVTIYDACFDRALVYGTVFGGVMFRNKTTETPLFSIHTIYWYKGNPVPPLSGCEHIALCEELFYQNNIRQISYTKDNSVIFGLPVLCKTEHDAERIASQLPYEIYSIQYRSIRNTQIFQVLIQANNRECIGDTKNIETTTSRCSQRFTSGHHHPNPPPPNPNPNPNPPPNPNPNPPNPTSKKLFIQSSDDMLTNIQAVFIVRPNLQNDIYELFVMPDTYRERTSKVGSVEPVFHNFALIPSFKTSVFMNRLFRNISENERLDTMEESEDEADFDNIEPDKYVTLSKECIMLCRFHKRFCKWVPVEIATKNEIITQQQAKQHEIRYVNHYTRMR
jgi:hypothetical protein